MKRIWNNYKRNEQGAVAVEATLSLSFFMFMIVTLLSFVNLCTAQATIGAALNETAKEISQYTYFYSLSGLNEIQSESIGETEETRADVDTIVANVADSLQELKGLANQERSPEDTADSLGEAWGNVDAVIQKIQTSDDPSEWVMGVIRIGANEGYEMLKGQLAGALTKQLMKKHLTNEAGQNCDAYLKHLGVADGIDGLDCSNSALFVYGTDDIILNCRYELKVIQLFHLDITYSISQNAYTKVWGGKALFRKSEEEEDGQEIAGGAFALVGDEEGKLFGVYASRAEKDGEYVDVIVHTSADGQSFSVYQNGGWVTISHRDLAKWLESRGYKKDAPIRLISCGAGADTSNLAQNLSNKLGVEVKAPTDTIWASPDGTLTIGPTKDSNTGTWKEFKPGVNPNTGS